MSVSYLIAFDKSLTKTEFLYKYILESKQTVFSENDKIVFCDKLYPQEQEIALTLFPQRKVYSVRSSVPLSYQESDILNISEKYYSCEKEQLVWLLEFLKKHIHKDEDVLFFKTNLGHAISYSQVLVNQVDVNDIKFPPENFSFGNCIYQFVNNKK